MDINTILKIISTLGFPIAAVIALCVFIFIFIIYKHSVDREKTLMAEIKENRKINADAIATIGHYAERLDDI